MPVESSPVTPLADPVPTPTLRPELVVFQTPPVTVPLDRCPIRPPMLVPVPLVPTMPVA